MPKALDVPIEKLVTGAYKQRMGDADAALDELCSSIRRLGIIVPITVRPEGEQFVVVAGHRRVAAARRLGLSEVPAVVCEAVPAEVEEVAFAENFFRVDLSPLELACAIEDCIKNKIMTMDELVAGFHRSERWVRGQVTLLSWPANVLQAIHAGWLGVTAASNIALIEDDTYRDFLLRNAEANGATARTTAAWLQAWRSLAPPEAALNAEPVAAGVTVTPAVPQAPCLCCGQVFRTDQLSHVPVCAGCISAIRSIGQPS